MSHSSVPTDTEPGSGAGAPAGTRAGEPLVRSSHVDKHFGDLHVLKNINPEVSAGEVVMVIGPSGSGESTLCRAINRLETIDSGEITVDGKALPEEGRALAKLRADVGMVFQSFNLFAHNSVLQNVTLGPMLVRGTSKKRPRNGPWGCRTGWVWATRRTNSPRSCPAVNNAWPLPVHWPWAPRSCCSTNRPPRWIPR